MRNTALIVASVGGVCGYIFGYFDISLIILLIMSILDIFLGIINAIKRGELSSTKGRNGAIHKIAQYSLIIFAILIDELLNTNGAVKQFVVLYNIVNESISILENIALCGVKIPQKVLDILDQLKTKVD